MFQQSLRNASRPIRTRVSEASASLRYNSSRFALNQNPMSTDLSQTIQSALEPILRAKAQEMERELAARLHSEWQSSLEQCHEKARQARRDTAESLAAAVRHIRTESSVTSIAHALVDAAASFAGRTGLFILREDRLLGFHTSGASSVEVQSKFEQIDLALSEAAAIAHVAESRDCVVTSGSPNDLSSQVVDLFGLKPEDRVHLFPVVLRDQVLAVLYANAGTESKPVESAAIEVLTCVAEAWIEAVGSRKKASLVREEAAV